MDVREITDARELSERYGADWQRIAAASPQATVFQTWEWTQTWWTHYGAGKKQRLWAFAFLENGAVVGFAALFFSALPSPLRVARFVGAGGSDYLDLLALPGQEQAVADAFLYALSERRGRWDWVDLQQIRPGAVAAMHGDGEEEDAARRVRTQAWQGETCPYLPLPGDWETFRKGLGKKLRANIGYYERALGKVYEVEMRLATAQTLDADLDDFFDLHQRRWNRRWLPGAFASRRARAFHADAARRLLAAGMLRLHMLLLDGEAQAALYCFQKGERCAYYLGGFAPELARYSIGTVLTAQAIRYAIEQDGAAEFDFLRGDEGYKYRWGAQDRFNRRLSLTHFGLRPALLSLGGRVSLSGERAFKAWMHRKHGGKTDAEQQQKQKRPTAAGDETPGE